MENNEKIKLRLRSNILILEHLKKLVYKYPEQRFGQILQNYILPKGDPFYEESVDTLNRLSRNCREAGDHEPSM